MHICIRLLHKDWWATSSFLKNGGATEYLSDAVPFKHKDLNKWIDFRHGISFTAENMWFTFCDVFLMFKMETYKPNYIKREDHSKKKN